MRRVLLVLFAVALALAAPAVARSQALPQDLFVEAGLYSNVVTVYGEDLDEFEIVLTVKNAGGTVLAQMDVYPPYGVDGNRAVFFLTDWTDAAAYLGLLPGEWLDLEFRYHGAPGPRVSHQLSDIEVVSTNVGTDTIKGRISPRQSPKAFLSFTGMKFVPGGLPPSLNREFVVREDGTFTVNAGGTADLVRNSPLFIRYEFDVFGIYTQGFVPGLIVIEDTPFAIATGTPLVSYPGRLLKPGGAVRGTSTAQPLQWLGVGLFQFHKGRAGAPIRRGDTIKVGGDLPYCVKVPRNFGVRIVEGLGFNAPQNVNFLSAPPSIVLTAPAGNLVCLAYTSLLSLDDLHLNLRCGTLADLDAGLPDAEFDADGNLVITPLEPSYPNLAAIAFTGGATGDVFVSHAGLQNPLTFLLTNLGLLLNPTAPER